MHVGICGAGIGGVMAGICLANAGAQVTILEATEQLGEVSRDWCIGDRHYHIV